ncbi:tRNA 5-methylaminomethyl-2-thiouridine biosynthesis bifunctional protein [Pseudidiomarina planktonica]|uniref:tRNA 5-methylaminomethyl-2-thiouridine biosynthesis bifunctional protein MnmC n=1 Tax=Pseudidiomarina planktonica TaxID=1323738 RepID=A0A1Y6EKT0_9GAMM|nr:bifunctional tRNA (5-methylaminomethyl-2-thiouridine)(34)-methyltransferase MnmD/FAD-dependent 5-carboxymethylaminomethyl-2-thiouridine(34) oxidoreductase MnmC [Pseudidiomarina planktonica]RUO65732.1 bifunctional tRNA (5-methylaminomethyl-2-thiouridine)(34)-methyltransferase MnmD/FAD-dependent 5-carboxymethylaminomethyl-2-thiouridine(34) oxidoreductase MnmC [Pseudidiomarina planktonica]SMQ63197.1 tRNA 5-methylaminomethyl-2-thiouridine biosynthesis bifunctional protein [Pseudidiomarina plankton
MTATTPADVYYSETGVPVSQHFDDIYFNPEAGLAESRYVFLTQNGLPGRWQSHLHADFRVAESGFGTGLNFLSTWQSMVENADRAMHLHFISFEKHPLSLTDLRRSLANFPELASYAEQLLSLYPPAESGCHRLLLESITANQRHRITLDLWLGDIVDTLPDWLPGAENTIDAWFLDGFTPDKNPRMWQPELFQAMAVSARSGCTFATFTAAGAVKRGLQAANCKVYKHKGFGVKREMLYGQVQPAEATAERKVLTESPVIIGGGIAATLTARALAQRGVTSIIVSEGIADAASGNHQAACYPLLQAERSPTSEFYVSAFTFAQRLYRSQFSAITHWHGVSQIAVNPEREKRYRKVADNLYSKELVQNLSSQLEPDTVTATTLAAGGLHYPTGGWLQPQSLVQQCLHDAEAQVVQQRIVDLVKTAEGWQLNCADGSQIQTATVILAAGAGNKALLEKFDLALQNVRGQVTLVKASAERQHQQQVICYKGYVTPPHDGLQCVGATFQRDDDNTAVRAADDAENIKTLQQQLPGKVWQQDFAVAGQRAAVRSTTRDHLPVVGALQSGLYVIGGLGSRGFTSAPLAAELLTSQLLAEPLPLAQSLLHRLRPERLQRRPLT